MAQRDWSDNCFLIDVTEGEFPSERAFDDAQGGKASDLDEERRLCYVAITRAKRRLFVSGVLSRNNEKSALPLLWNSNKHCEKKLTLHNRRSSVKKTENTLGLFATLSSVSPLFGLSPGRLRFLLGVLFRSSI